MTDLTRGRCSQSCRGIFIIFVLLVLLCAFGCKTSQGNSDASLSNLTVLDGTLSPAFSPGILTYDVNFPSFPRSVRVSAVTNDGEATLTINGTPVYSGQELQVNMSTPPNNVVRFVVTASDGETTRTYVVSVIVE
ncbi:MAG: cadherin-like beta sandwich domain-containing protein [Candidatus Aminicenantes bacterium]|nr:cadherin-like beta sandwich domain-containing protein [Candidatus Aminicenantes bacterium]